jgi:hypothetical protein
LTSGICAYWAGGGLVLGPGFGHFQDPAGIPDSSFGRIRDSGQSQDSGFLGTDPDSGFWTVQIFLHPKVPKRPSNASKRAGLQILDACLFDPRFEIPDPRFGRIRDSGYPDTFQDGPGILAPPGFRIRYYPIPPVGQIHPLSLVEGSVKIWIPIILETFWNLLGQNLDCPRSPESGS